MPTKFRNCLNLSNMLSPYKVLLGVTAAFTSCFRKTSALDSTFCETVALYHCPTKDLTKMINVEQFFISSDLKHVNSTELFQE